MLLGSLGLLNFYMQCVTDNREIQTLGVQYVGICAGCGILIIAQLVLERMLISTGKTKYSMISQLTGALTNIVLDPIMIFGYFGCPAMGISGAAYATVIGQLLAVITAYKLNKRVNREVEITFKRKPAGYAVQRIITLGLPSTILLTLSSMMILSFDLILGMFSTTAVAVFGVCQRVTGLFYQLVNALCSAAMPLISYNHGARHKKRINEVIRCSYIYSVVLMSCGTILCCGFPEIIMHMFSATDEMMGIGVMAMRCLCILFPMVAVKNTGTCIMQALGHSISSMAVDITRNYILLIPLAYLFAQTGVLDNVWLSIPAADLISAAVSVLMVMHFYKKDIKTMPQEAV